MVLYGVRIIGWMLCDFRYSPTRISQSIYSVSQLVSINNNIKSFYVFVRIRFAEIIDIAFLLVITTIG